MAAVNPWERTELLIGTDGLHTLASARVMVVGLGGVGSYAVEALARAGIGALDLVDGDVLTYSNLNRQLLATQKTIGQAKVSAAAQRTAEINPQCRVTEWNLWVTPDNAMNLLQTKPDYIIDAIDDLTAKAALIKAAQQVGVPTISVLGTARRIDPWTGFQHADISVTHTCPLARSLRKRLRQLGIEKGVSVIYTPQPPYILPMSSEEISKDEWSDASRTYSKQPLGSISYVPGQAGLIAAGIAITSLLDKAR